MVSCSQPIYLLIGPGQQNCRSNLNCSGCHLRYWNGMELGINLLDPAAKVGLTIFTEKNKLMYVESLMKNRLLTFKKQASSKQHDRGGGYKMKVWTCQVKSHNSYITLQA